ncbi:MAG: TIM barrel protein [Candidatus Thalassarchaeaceae archaeon]|jgi:deoxyribonuclease-4|nr:TIM barrel protein [Candidatus Thalassarchaeaceae archaeon]
MDDITALGLSTMEIQTVRTVAPQHFNEYWQAGILSWKSDFEMNMHGPYYADLLGDRRSRQRTLMKMETSMQAAKIVNARHITYHVGPYGDRRPGRETNEHLANILEGVVERCRELWGKEEDEIDYAAFPWVTEGEPTLIGVETSGQQSLWGTLDEVLEVVNHVDGTVPVLNMAHIHARGNGSLRTSEDFAELFDQVRSEFGGKKFYCHFSGIEHRSGNAMHYTQLKKSDLKFEPLAEYLAEEGDWLDVTVISDSPLLEHDAMYMLQQYDKAKQKLLERRALEERRIKLALEAGLDPAELLAREKEQARLRMEAGDPESAPPKVEKKAEPKKKPAASKKAASARIDFEEEEDDDDLF